MKQLTSLRALAAFAAGLALALAGNLRAEEAPAWAKLDTGVKHRVLAADSSKRRLAIFGEDGKMEWERPIRDLHDLHVLENGNYLIQDGWTRVVEITPKGEEVWSYDAGKMNGNEGKKVEVHAFQRLANGDTMIAESGPARIIEVAKDGKLVHEVKMRLEKPDVHRDTRMVRKLANGNYLACHEGDGRVREYAPDGSTAWEYNLQGDKSFDHHGSGVAVFGAIRLPNGNTLIATGNGHSVIEVTPKGETVWKLTSEDLPGVKLAWVTTLEVLPDGNIVVGNCHAGKGQPQIIEVTREKKLVWAFYDFEKLGDSTTNSQMIDLAGKTVR